LQYVVVPLQGNDCFKSRAVFDYVSWILEHPEAATIAESLEWAVMPNMVSQHAMRILENMTCTSGFDCQFDSVD
jgi:hypothetical protein